MASNYKIGVTPANLESLDTLGFECDPLSDFTPFSGRRQQMGGTVVGTGLPIVKWRFTEMTLEQLGNLLYFLTGGLGGSVLPASRYVYIQTRVVEASTDVRVWQVYRALMMRPMEPDDLEYGMHFKYSDVEFVFTHCQEVP